MKAFITHLIVSQGQINFKLIFSKMIHMKHLMRREGCHFYGVKKTFYISNLDVGMK